MNAMLRPPVQTVRDLGWRQLLGLDQAEDGLWAGLEQALAPAPPADG